MAKTIMISDHVYEELTKLKKPGESYTKVIDRFIHASRSKKELMAFAGAFNFISADSAQELLENVTAARKNSTRTKPW